MAGSRGIRVVAGSLRGRRLAVGRGDAIRPTLDRVREAVFSALDVRGALDDTTVLDCYAGTGVLGIESVSRGANRAVLVERDRDALATIGGNVATCAISGQVRVVGRDVGAFLAGPPPPEAPFDVVFLDPPYDLPDATLDAQLGLLVTPGWLGDDAFVVAERSARGVVVPPPGLEMTWERTFGDTLIAFMHRSAA